ncbi:uncharacterized protein LOC144822414 [Lissotriton helveticus]
MPPKRPTNGKGAPAKRDDYLALTEIMEYTKEKGVDWALKTMRDGARADEKAQEERGRGKRTRRTPERFKEALKDKRPRAAEPQPASPVDRIPCTLATGREDNDNIPSGAMEVWCPTASELISASLAPKTKIWDPLPRRRTAVLLKRLPL